MYKYLELARRILAMLRWRCNRLQYPAIRFTVNEARSWLHENGRPDPSDATMRRAIQHLCQQGEIEATAMKRAAYDPWIYVYHHLKPELRGIAGRNRKQGER